MVIDPQPQQPGDNGVQHIAQIVSVVLIKYAPPPGPARAAAQRCATPLPPASSEQAVAAAAARPQVAETAGETFDATWLPGRAAIAP